MLSNTQRITVVADDLTGAADTGVQFARANLKAIVAIDHAAIGEAADTADVLIIDTDSRSSTPRIASRQVRAALANISGRVYKKIDSTLRGNIGSEVAAALDVLDRQLAVVCPALVAIDRLARDGILYVNGVPVHESPLASDPAHPITAPTISAAISKQTKLPITNVGLGEVRQGSESLASVLQARRGIAVVDSETEGDLRVVASAIQHLGDLALPVGSAGLAAALVPLWRRPSDGLPANVVVHRPSFRSLIVRGSQNPRSRHQTEIVAEYIGSSEIDAFAAGAMAEAIELLFRDGAVVLVAPEQSSMSADAIASRLARFVSSINGRVGVQGLVLTGGDTARAVLVGLRTSALRIDCEVAPGMPASVAIGGALDGRTVITKAGGFGAPDALIGALNHLAGGGRTR